MEDADLRVLLKRNRCHTSCLMGVVKPLIEAEVAKAVAAKEAEMRPALVALVKLAKKVKGYHPEDLPYHLHETTGLHVWQAEQFIALAATEDES